MRFDLAYVDPGGEHLIQKARRMYQAMVKSGARRDRLFVGNCEIRLIKTGEDLIQCRIFVDPPRFGLFSGHGAGVWIENTYFVRDRAGTTFIPLGKNSKCRTVPVFPQENNGDAPFSYWEYHHACAVSANRKCYSIYFAVNNEINYGRLMVTSLDHKSYPSFNNYYDKNAQVGPFYQVPVWNSFPHLAYTGKRQHSTVNEQDEVVTVLEDIVLRLVTYDALYLIRIRDPDGGSMKGNIYDELLAVPYNPAGFSHFANGLHVCNGVAYGLVLSHKLENINGDLTMTDYQSYMIRTADHGDTITRINMTTGWVGKSTMEYLGDGVIVGSATDFAVSLTFEAVDPLLGLPFAFNQQSNIGTYFRSSDNGLTWSFTPLWLAFDQTSPMAAREFLATPRPSKMTPEEVYHNAIAPVQKFEWIPPSNVFMELSIELYETFDYGISWTLLCNVTNLPFEFADFARDESEHSMIMTLQKPRILYGMSDQTDESNYARVSVMSNLVLNPDDNLVYFLLADSNYGWNGWQNTTGNAKGIKHADACYLCRFDKLFSKIEVLKRLTGATTHFVTTLFDWGNGGTPPFTGFIVDEIYPFQNPNSHKSFYLVPKDEKGFKSKEEYWEE